MQKTTNEIPSSSDEYYFKTSITEQHEPSIGLLKCTGSTDNRDEKLKHYWDTLDEYEKLDDAFSQLDYQITRNHYDNMMNELSSIVGLLSILEKCSDDEYTQYINYIKQQYDEMINFDDQNDINDRDKLLAKCTNSKSLMTFDEFTSQYSNAHKEYVTDDVEKTKCYLDEEEQAINKFRLDETKEHVEKGSIETSISLTEIIKIFLLLVIIGQLSWVCMYLPDK